MSFLGKITMFSLASAVIFSAAAIVVPVVLHVYYGKTPTTSSIIPVGLEPEAAHSSRSAHNTILFYSGGLIFLGVGIVVSLGDSWRKPVYKHTGLLITTGLVLFTMLFLMFMPLSWDFLGFWKWCEFVEIGLRMKLVIVIVSIISLLLMLIVQKLLYYIQ
jgi:hypothetical protein